MNVLVYCLNLYSDQSRITNFLSEYSPLCCPHFAMPNCLSVHAHESFYLLKYFCYYFGLSLKWLTFVLQLQSVDDPETNVPRWIVAYLIWLSEKVFMRGVNSLIRCYLLTFISQTRIWIFRIKRQNKS